MNSVVVSLFGFTSALTGGLVSDKYEKKGIYMTKAYVCMFCGTLGIPTIVLCLLVQSSFWFSISMLALEYLFAEGWVGPAITMVVNTITPENKGFAVSAFLFMATVAGTVSNILLGALLDHSKAEDHPDLYGKYLCIFVVFSYGGSLPFFWLAGREYTKVKRRAEEAKQQED